jgi:hypothetical protein
VARVAVLHVRDAAAAWYDFNAAGGSHEACVHDRDETVKGRYEISHPAVELSPKAALHTKLRAP